MRRNLRGIFLLISILILLFGLSSCSILEELLEEPVKTKPAPNTAYGVELPSDCWITDCMLLSSDTGLQLSDLLGTGGDSGLLSDYALEMDGKDLQRVIREEHYINEMPCYLACLFYGDFPSTELVLETYLKFALVTETGVLYDEDCVELLGWEYVIDLDADVLVNMNNPADGKLMISPGESSSSMTLGIVVIPFRLLYDGTLYADLRLEYAGTESLSKTYIDKPAVAVVGEQATADNQVSIENFSVNYLTEAAYNMGNYSDDDFTPSPSFNDDNVCYMVMDFGYKANNDNDGTQSINIMACVPEAEIMKATIEEAPTGKIEEIVTDNITSIYASFSIPTTANTVKNVRMVIKLTSLSEGVASVDVFLVGTENVQTTGHSYICTELVSGTPTLRYTLSNDGTYYTVTGLWQANITELNIPDTYRDLPVKELAPDFLQDNSYITSITVGNNITHLPSNVFDGCSSLQEIVVGTGIEELPESFFADLSTLHTITLHEGISYIPENCFQNCSSLVTVNGINAVTEIGSAAFSGCSSLETLNCGTIYNIPDNCFQNCSSLVTVNGIEAVTSIGASAFSGCSSLETLNCGRVTSIGGESFHGCSSLKTINTICVSTIPSRAFADCTSLLWFDLAGVTIVEAHAFENCKSLDQIIIPDSCIFVDDYAFAGTSGVKHIYIGENLAPEYEFVHSNGELWSNSVDLGEAFDRTSLESIRVSDGSKYWYASGNCLMRKSQLDKDGNIVNLLIIGCNNSVIPDETTHIGRSAFQNCTKLTNISLPDNIKEIGRSAFMNCTGLQTINLPDGLEDICFSSFAGCKSLQSITIPGSVKFIGSGAFRDCTSLTTVDMPYRWYIAKSAYDPSQTLYINTKKDAAEYLTSTYCDYMFVTETYLFHHTG